MTLTFPQARDFVMPLGKYAGKTLDQIAFSDTGLLYLDWLRGERRRYKDALNDALAVYLSDESIAADLKQAMKKDSRPLKAERGEGLEWRSRDPSAD